MSEGYEFIDPEDQTPPFDPDAQQDAEYYAQTVGPEKRKVLDIAQLAPWNGVKFDHDFLDAAYVGSGGFRDGSYLVPHPREAPEKFNRRKALAYYANYVAAVVDSLIDPIFRKVAAREWDGRKQKKNLFSIFMQDVDRRKTSLAKFMKRAAKIAKVHEVAFIVVDNYPEQPLNIADALAGRILPYAYIVKPQQVQSYECDVAGNLESITYDIIKKRYSSGTTTQEVIRWTWTRTTWQKEEKGETTQGEHTLGVVPVVPLFTKDHDPGDLLPEPTLFPVAQTNLTIYNLCSELRELLRAQAFAILTYPITSQVDREDLKSLVQGTENVLGYDGEGSNAPDFIAPPAEQAAFLQSEITRLVEEIYRMSKLNSVVGVQTKNSGVAKEWDFDNTNQVLADTADNCQEAEKQVAFLFEKWTGQAVNYVCNYPDDFGIVDVQAELDEVTSALALAIGGKFNEECKLKAAEVYLKDLPEDRFDAVTQDIKQRAETEAQADDAAAAAALEQEKANAATAKREQTGGGEPTPPGNGA